MAILPHGLEIADYGTQGWNAIYSSNFEKLDDRIGNALISNKRFGEASITDSNINITAGNSISTTSLTDNSSGTIGDTIEATADGTINNNFASITDRINKIENDLNKLKSKQDELVNSINDLSNKIDELLSLLRTNTGTGIFKDNP